ncbi:MAG TPA: hypothetical protein VF642_12340 [Propionibacteriaceae bacterium]|jgi:hypothetical protein
MTATLCSCIRVEQVDTDWPHPIAYADPECEWHGEQPTHLVLGTE